MTSEDYAELMEEPPGGVNHGRERRGATWHSLESDESWGRSPSTPEEPRKHGIRYTAQKIGCGCDDCRDWRREHRRKARESVTTPSFVEGRDPTE